MFLSYNYNTDWKIDAINCTLDNNASRICRLMPWAIRFVKSNSLGIRSRTIKPFLRFYLDLTIKAVISSKKVGQ